MSVNTELKDFLKSTIKSIIGKEANKIPLSGLSLNATELNLAKSLLVEGVNFQDEGIIREYEEQWSKFVGVELASSFISGRAALSAIIKAFGFGPGDKVIIQAFTCVAVPNAFVFEGLEVVYCDIELDTYGLDFEDLKRKVNASNNVKAVVIQHTFGLVSRDSEEIIRWCEDNGIKVIEDCAHAVGSRVYNSHVGTMGDAAFFSSERSKPISTFKGGIALSRDPTFSMRIREVQESIPYPENGYVRKLLEHFIMTYYVQRDKGRWYKKMFLKPRMRTTYIPGTSAEEIAGRKPLNYLLKMSSAQAALGLSQMKKIDEVIEHRLRLALEWEYWTKQKGLTPPKPLSHCKNVLLRFPVLVSPEKKNDLAWTKNLEAEIGVWYKTQVHPRAVTITNCPKAIKAVQQCINLPINFVQTACDTL